MKMLSLFFALLAFLPSSAFANQPVYYVHLDGGSYYHKEPNCASVAEKYWSQMSEITNSDLDKSTYSHLKPCPICASTFSPMVTPENPYVMRYESVYDTADDVHISTAGIYQANKDLNAGIYTALASPDCKGFLQIYTSDQTLLYQYEMNGNGSFTFYLGENMMVSLPDEARLQKLMDNMHFQTEAGVTTTVYHQRYVTMNEMPGHYYYVTNVPNQDGYFVVSSIDSEMGKEQPVRVDVRNGNIAHLDLMGQFDVFVELVNCVVWVGESEG